MSSHVNATSRKSYLVNYQEYDIFKRPLHSIQFQGKSQINPAAMIQAKNHASTSKNKDRVPAKVVMLILSFFLSKKGSSDQLNERIKSWALLRGINIPPIISANGKQLYS
jgi:hypothetical protein